MEPKLCAVVALLAGCALAPAWAAKKGTEAPVRLALPVGMGAEGGVHLPGHSLRLWARDLSDRLVLQARARAPSLRWQAARNRFALKSEDAPLLLERSRASLTAHWQPWEIGAWKLGASMGVSKALPGAPAGNTTFAALPMATYEQSAYRLHMGLVAPRGEREPTLLLGLSMPLR